MSKKVLPVTVAAVGGESEGAAIDSEGAGTVERPALCKVLMIRADERWKCQLYVEYVPSLGAQSIRSDFNRSGICNAWIKDEFISNKREDNMHIE